MASLIYLAHSPNIDPTDHSTYTDRFRSATHLAHGHFSDTYEIWGPGIYEHFSSGDTIYVKVYPAISASLEEVYDIYVLDFVFYGYGEPSNTLYAIVP